jgi:heptosyltransferase-1
VIGVDTGLTHLAAALGVPVVGLFGATDPRSTGVRAPGTAVNLGGVGRFPATDEVVDALHGIELPA